MGLISGALSMGLAEGAKEAGDYIGKSALLEQQGQQTLDLEKIKDEMAAKRETALQELRGSQEREQRQAEIGSRETIAREQMASHEKISAEHKKTLEGSFRNQGLSVQTDAEGNMGVIDLKSRTFKPFVDDKGAPVKGLKDLPLTVKTYVSTITDSLKALDKEEASGMLAPDGQEKLQQRRAALNAQLLDTLTTGRLPSGTTPAAPVPQNRPPLTSFFGGGARPPAESPKPKQRSIQELTRDIGVITQQLNDPNLRDADRASLQAALDNLSSQIAAQNR
jgi:hypothetical protein